MMWPGNGPGGCNTLIDVCIFIRKREIILVQTKMKTLSALCCLLKFVLGVFCVGSTGVFHPSRSGPPPFNREN